MNHSTPGLPVHHQLLEFTQTHVHQVSDAIQPSHPRLSPSPPSIRVFSNESTLCTRWPNYWNFSFSISPSNEYSGLMSFRMGWLDLLAVQGTLKSFLQHQSSIRLTSIESMMPSRHLILCRPLLLLPPIPPSIRVFSRESTLGMRWPKYWSFSFSIIPSKEIPGLISFRMDWLDLLAVQGTLKSLLQHHSSLEAHSET